MQEPLNDGGVIRKLWIGEAGIYRDHLLRLDRDSRYSDHGSIAVDNTLGSFSPFQGRLYVGASGWVNSLFPISEMIRINPDDTWQLVAEACGAASWDARSRRDAGGGLRAGIGNERLTA